jgi:hypothetical protein
VTETVERVAIVASGPSLRGIALDFPRSVTVIAVNAAIDHIPRADFWFSMDAHYLGRGQPNMTRMLHRRPGTRYYVAVRPYGRQHPGIVHLRRDRAVNDDKSPRGLSEDPTGICVGNSAWGALQLAYLMGRPAKVALFGVDGTQAGYAWGDGNPGTLKHLPVLFRTAMAQLEAAGMQVVNGSPRSMVDCFPRMTVNEAMEWLRP